MVPIIQNTKSCVNMYTYTYILIVNLPHLHPSKLIYWQICKCVCLLNYWWGLLSEKGSQGGALQPDAHILFCNFANYFSLSMKMWLKKRQADRCKESGMAFRKLVSHCLQVPYLKCHGYATSLCPCPGGAWSVFWVFRMVGLLRMKTICLVPTFPTFRSTWDGTVVSTV